MTERWFFNSNQDGSISLRATAEGEGQTIGDAYDELRPSDKVLPGRPSYKELLAADKGGGGTVTFNADGSYKVTSGGPEPPPPPPLTEAEAAEVDRLFARDFPDLGEVEEA